MYKYENLYETVCHGTPRNGTVRFGEQKSLKTNNKYEDMIWLIVCKYFG